MIWRFEKEGDQFFDEWYIKELLKINGLKQSKVKLEKGKLTIKFRNHPFKGLILVAKLHENGDEKLTKGIVHHFNPLFTILFIIALPSFIYGFLTDPVEETTIPLIFLMIILIFHFFKYKYTLKELFYILRID